MNITFIARSFVFLALSAGFAYLVWMLMETAPRHTRERPAAPVPLVDVIDPTSGTTPLEVHAFGEVQAVHRLQVRPQVQGRLVDTHPEFEPGGLLPAGATIVQIDRSDYLLAVEAAKAEVAKAQAGIAIEKGRTVVAREELDILGREAGLDRESRDLALRKPQLRQVQAELAAARNRLAQARQDLERTAYALPYDTLVLAKTRNKGEIVGARELLGEVARADEFWVQLKVDPAYIPQLRARDTQAGKPGSAVSVIHGGARYPGELVRILPELAADSRLAGVIVSVRDPLGLHGGDHARPPLLIGSYVEAVVDAGMLQNVIRVPAAAVRDNGRVFVADAEDRFQVRTPAVAWRLRGEVLLRPELQPGDRVIVNRNARLVPGTRVRTRTAQGAGTPAAR